MVQAFSDSEMVSAIIEGIDNDEEILVVGDTRPYIERLQNEINRERPANTVRKGTLIYNGQRVDFTSANQIRHGASRGRRVDRIVIYGAIEDPWVYRSIEPCER